MKMKITSLAAAGLIGTAVSGASATTLPAVLWEFEASNTNGDSGTAQVMLSDPGVFFFTPDAIFWQASGPISIWDGGNLLATVSSATISMGTSPFNAFIDMSFTIENENNFDTSFSVSSGTLDNIGFTEAFAQFDGSVNMTDGDDNGSFATALNNGNFLTADLNGLTYQDIVDGDGGSGTLAAGVSLSTNDDETLPDEFVGIVNSASISFDFEVSANDQFGGTASINIFPTPGTVGLLGLSGLLAARRRR